MSKKRAPLSFNVDSVVTKKPAIKADRSSKIETVEADENTQAIKQANTATSKGSREGKQFIAAHVPTEAAKQFKILALQQDMTAQDLLTEAINDLFAKYHLSRIA